MRLSDSQIDQIKDLAKKRIPIKDIAKQVGVSTSTVRSRLISSELVLHYKFYYSRSNFYQDVLDYVAIEVNKLSDTFENMFQLGIPVDDLRVCSFYFDYPYFSTYFNLQPSTIKKLFSINIRNNSINFRMSYKVNAGNMIDIFVTYTYKHLRQYYK